MLVSGGMFLGRAISGQIRVQFLDFFMLCCICIYYFSIPLESQQTVDKSKKIPKPDFSKLRDLVG